MNPELRILLAVLFCIANFVFSADKALVCSVRPPSGSPSGLYVDGSKLCWNGKPLKMAGYGTTDLATRNGYDFRKFLNTIRLVDTSDSVQKHGANMTRIWATGTSNHPDCSHTHQDHDPAQPSMTMPFQMMHGTQCTKQKPDPKYNMCIGPSVCADNSGLNIEYTKRLQNILIEARKNGVLVELVLFDAYFLGRHRDGDALYAKNPWNPLNNNMNQNRFLQSPGSDGTGSCAKLYKSKDPLDISNDAFPEFYDICSDVSSSEKCDATLNCLGLIQKSYVEAMVDLVRNNRAGSDHVFFEVMNRARFEKRDPRKEGFNLEKFKRWHDVVGYWIKCRGDGRCGSTAGDYLVMAEVGIADFAQLTCKKPSDCRINSLDVLAMPNIDLINLQAYTWNNSAGAPGPCKTAMIALNKFKKPVTIDTDSAYKRNDKCLVEQWAEEVSHCGSPGEVHFNHLDGMTFGYPAPKLCSFTGKGDEQIYMDFDEKYLDCHVLDTMGAAGATYLSDIISTAPPQSCPHSVDKDGKLKWCATTCSAKIKAK